MREFRSFRVSCTAGAFDPGLSRSFRRLAAEADWAASRVRSRAVSSMFDIRARDSIFGIVGNGSCGEVGKTFGDVGMGPAPGARLWLPNTSAYRAGITDSLY